MDAVSYLALGRVFVANMTGNIIFLGFWFVQQFLLGAFGLVAPQDEGGGIAWWAHIGGFAAGFVLVWLFRNRGGARPRARAR